MENGHLHDDKLFRAVHDRLSDYEAPANGADWDAMSRSLDNLPKTARYRWKVSLNTILVIVGLAGVSALSYALATKKGTTSDTKANPQHTVTTQPAKPKPNPVVPVNNAQPSQNSFASSNELGFSAVSPVTNAENTNSPVVKTTDASATTVAMNPDGPVKKRKKNQLLFGDQIDPKKGFIYNTKENPNNIVPPVDPAPNVFYDYNDNGQLKKIEIKKDSTSRGSNKSKADSTAKIFTPGVPTEGGPTGFDTE